MAPHLVGRPISLLRCPEGASRPKFLSEACVCRHSADRPALVRKTATKILSLDDLDGLLSLVQAGVLEVHVRGSTIEQLGCATGWCSISTRARHRLEGRRGCPARCEGAASPN